MKIPKERFFIRTIGVAGLSLIWKWTDDHLMDLPGVRAGSSQTGCPRSG